MIKPGDKVFYFERVACGWKKSKRYPAIVIAVKKRVQIEVYEDSQPQRKIWVSAEHIQKFQPHLPVHSKPKT